MNTIRSVQDDQIVIVGFNKVDYQSFDNNQS